MSGRKRSNAEWRAVVAACESSGMKQQAWCLANQINYYTYCDRARRLRRIDEEGDSGRPMFAAKPKLSWVEVKEEQSGEQSDLSVPIVPEPVEPQPEQTKHSEIHIKVGSFTVAVTEDFNEALFVRVLAVLNGACGSGGAARSC